MVAVLAIVIRHAQTEAVRMRTYGRLSQLRLALANYEHVHGGLPPRQQTDGNGIVHFNWLVAVLPQMEHGDLQAALDLSNRWDTSHNLNVARSDALFLDFITRDGYIACPLNGEESIWNPLTGLPVGNLTESSRSIALIAAPMDSTQPFEPLSVTKDELRVLAANGKRSFFIRSDGKYGPVTLANGRVEFPLP